MRMSCNGCRVLRKGCSDACSIRPCLQWIKDPESQANATVFLAKFYGRAGLLNLINAAAPANLRPAIFRSLLYEACGRIVNPTYGSVGLLWSGSWQTCQAAVEAVLSGKPIVQIPSDASPPPFNAYDIRHVTHVASADLHKVTKPTAGRTRFKRSAHHAAAKASRADPQIRRAQSLRRESSSEEDESLFSEETAEASHVSQAAPGGREESEVELELTLGFEPARPAVRTEPEPRRVEMDGSDDDMCEMELGLELKN